jgi:NO-binding membrane sensor protein with MHYT domain
MGAAVAAMHYTGMAALRMDPPNRYHPGLFSTSILIALAASTAGLWAAGAGTRITLDIPERLR